eukprot:606454-Pleurochrysis_carterae.AAC.1
MVAIASGPAIATTHKEAILITSAMAHSRRLTLPCSHKLVSRRFTHHESAIRRFACAADAYAREKLTRMAKARVAGSNHASIQSAASAAVRTTTTTANASSCSALHTHPWPAFAATAVTTAS